MKKNDDLKDWNYLITELAKHDEYVETCYSCGGVFLRKFAGATRIASKPPIVITSETKEKNKTVSMKITGGEIKEVYLCKNCEEKLQHGEIIYGE